MSAKSLDQKFKEASEKRRLRIAALREKGWTVYQIAEKEGVTAQRISQIMKQVKKKQAKEEPGEK